MTEKSKEITYLREIEIKYKKRKVSADAAIDKPIRGIKQILELFSDLQNETKEKMLTLLLDKKGRILCFEFVALGSLNAIYLRPMEVFRTAFPVNAHAAIVIHNHPSGDPSPSQDDKKLTKTLVRMANDMGLKFLDHVIIGDGDYYSFAEDDKLK
jgi:DNA repair protein RadC